MRKNTILGLVLVAGTTLTSGCGMIKNLTEMHDATGKMPDLMGQTIKGMDGTNKMMSTMCAGQGKLTTSDYRDKLLDQIDKEQDIGAKLSLAVKYHYAWEFQGMSAECGRTNAYSAKVFNESIREFLESMHRFISTRTATGSTSRNNDMNTLYALAATMHYTNSLQEVDGDKNNYQPVSMLDLFTDVVNDTKAIDAGTLSNHDIPEYVDSGRILIGDITYLLRLRYNFLTAFSFGLATTNVVGDEATLMGLAKYVLDGMFNRAWRPNFETKNTSQITYYGTIIHRALGARKLLETLGVDIQTDKTIYKVYRAIDFSSFDTKTVKSDPLNVSEKKEAVLALEALVNDYLAAKDMN